MTPEERREHFRALGKKGSLIGLARRWGLSAIDRFWIHVEKGEGDACWMWTGCLTRGTWGYGRFAVNGARFCTHRWIWEQEHGPVPPGLHVLHKCDTPQCVRIDHLFLGTQAENVADMERKGRSRRRALRGASNPQAVLSDAAVAAIRRRYTAGGVSQRELAEEYGITQSTVGKIVRGERWAYAS